MKEFKCNVAQKGFYAGPVFFIRSSSINREEKTSDIEGELARLQQAKSTLRSSVLRKNSTSGNAEIRETVLSILEDEAFTGRAENNIRRQSLKASAAVLKAADELTKAMGLVDSEYIRSRQEDIQGVADELVSILEKSGENLTEYAAICASEISPAQLSSMDESRIGGLLTDKGSPNSHASILAGNMNIPYLFGNPEAVAEAQKASFIILDSDTAIVIMDPEENVRSAALQRMEKVLEEKRNIEQMAEMPICNTKVYANIEGPQDIPALLESGAEGVGLFRTEFLFLGRDSIPTEEEQYEAYSQVLEAMGDKEVIIRTMDVGSDKKVSWLNIPEESNPALGLRGVRVSLERTELFNTQLRALMRAAVKGNLKVMFPMIASAWEVTEAKQHVNKAARELEQEKIAYKIPPLGIMVETPAAAVCAEELAEDVDFFSIGTNDLTQYTLALDREAHGLERYFNPHSEAVFKLIQMTAEGGNHHGIETGVCGQLAADPEAIQRLIASGVKELSVPIRKVRATKHLAAVAEQQIEADELLAKQESAPREEAVAPSVAAVADGQLVPMEEIPDPVFAEGTMGPCFGILPANGKIYSPVTGTVVAIAESGHAITIRAESGEEILVHVGIDTVKLGGKAFTHHVQNGEHVQQNQLMMEADLRMIENAGLSPMIIVIALA